MMLRMKCKDQEVMQLKAILKAGSLEYLVIKPTKAAKVMSCVMFLRLKESQRDR